MSMTEGWVRTLVESIHSKPTQFVLYLSGGASQALGWLMSIPGASNTVLEAVVPYSNISMVQLLGKIPTSFTSQNAAEELALLGYNRALKLSRPGVPVVGVGFTGALASTLPKRGEHRFYLSTRSFDRLWVSKVSLTKGFRTREQEDRISSMFLIKAIADSCGISTNFVSELGDSEYPEEYEKLFDEDSQLQQLIDGQICMKVYPFSKEYHVSSHGRKIILSGSFNPLHDGHLKLMEIASSILGHGTPCFEISAVNADKPALTISQIKNRVKQFEKIGKTVIISNQPYFFKKAELFPGSAFVIGADTAERLINPKYYGGSFDKMIEIMVECQQSGSIFLVGGRSIDGVFKVLEDLEIPEKLKSMFISIPEERFRMDISSTEIRNRE